MTLKVQICIGLSLTLKSGPLSTEQAVTVGTREWERQNTVIMPNIY